MLNTNYTPPFYALFLLLFFSVSIESVLANANQPLHQVSAKECKTCHEEIYSQWQGSMHANKYPCKINLTFYANSTL
ncbi:multiheme c-type cytochrome [Methyloprofundus sp.]|uniref:multiheme c-type cytochrome n=1 Tax=Methyloprofundus sp. TaxID=2020875 RepID=UPI003D114A24